MSVQTQQHHSILQSIAHRAMLARGLLPDFPGEVIAELGELPRSSAVNGNTIRDMRNLLWASIDNDDSRDLDQLTVAKALPEGKVNILVAIADVSLFVKPGSAIDKYARHNTTSVYTAAQIFPMLPEKLSTGVTSLNFNQKRFAIVVDMVVDANGALQETKIYPAWVRNRAKLAYNSVAAWLEKSGDIPKKIASVPKLAENLQMQHLAAQSMKNLRHLHGALSLETIQAKPVFDGDQIRALEIEEKNCAKEIIENFMIAANGVTARYLSDNGFPSIRRVVRTPKRWERIVEIAKERGSQLPEKPDSKALEEFLIKEKDADPVRFPDLSLAIIKLLGKGEYAAQLPDENVPGHFGLAVNDYAHSTAPNRRYPDLITQRLLKAALDGQPTPYTKEDLDTLATHCTAAEDAANKVERQVSKSAAALLLEKRIGEKFDAIVTGASEKGTWVRLFNPPIEGRLVSGFEGQDVGEKLNVQLIRTDVERGYIDFRKMD